MSKPSSSDWIVNDLLSKWSYFAEDDPAIPNLWVKESSSVYLVLGDNASGKSFFRRCFHQCALKETSIKEVIHLSMENRCSSMMGAAKAFVYGDEGSRSTGENSAHTIKTAIKTCQGREHMHVLYWDEPDVGMSDNASAGAAIQIAEFVNDLPEKTRGVVITTHSRVFVHTLLNRMDARPNYVHLGVPPDEAPATLEDWITREVVPISPVEVGKASHERFLKILKILKRKQKRKG